MLINIIEYYRRVRSHPLLSGVHTRPMCSSIADPQCQPRGGYKWGGTWVSERKCWCGQVSERREESTRGGRGAREAQGCCAQSRRRLATTESSLPPSTAHLVKVAPSVRCHRILET